MGELKVKQICCSVFFVFVLFRRLRGFRVRLRTVAWIAGAAASWTPTFAKEWRVGIPCRSAGEIPSRFQVTPPNQNPRKGRKMVNPKRR